jgi:hypothetical protein
MSNNISITGNSSLCTIESQSNNCAICLEQYTNPYELDCSHTFCYDCIQKSLISNNILCPLCRCQISNSNISKLNLVLSHTINISDNDNIDNDNIDNLVNLDSDENININIFPYSIICLILLVKLVKWILIIITFACYIVVLSYITIILVLLIYYLIDHKQIKLILHPDINLYISLSFYCWIIIGCILRKRRLCNYIFGIFRVYPFNILYSHTRIDE